MTQPKPQLKPIKETISSETKQHASFLDQIVEEQARERAKTAELYKPVMSADEFGERDKMVTFVVEKIMKEGVHYGWVPGTKPTEEQLKKLKQGEYFPKPMLFKAGAQLINSYFGYVPDYEVLIQDEDWLGEQHKGEMFFYYLYKCRLYKGASKVGEGIGSSNAWETKYRYRNEERVCTSCGVAAIIKGKAEYGGGWLCWNKKGGCGAKYTEGDPAIEGQKTGKVANPDMGEVVNVLQKQGTKRAYVEATLTALGLSGRFGQDMADTEEDKDLRTLEQRAADKKEAPAKLDIPPQIQHILDNLGKPGYMGQGLTFMKRNLEDVLGADVGTVRYRELIAKHNVTKGCKIANVHNCIVELWQVTEFEKEARENAPLSEDEVPGMEPEGARS